MRKQLIYILLFLISSKLEAQTKSDTQFVYIETPKSNVLYVGVDNIVRIEKPASLKNLKLKIQGGTVEAQDDHYIVQVKEMGELYLMVYDENDKPIGRKLFRVTQVPTPRAVALINLGNNHETRSNGKGLIAQYDNFEYECFFKITSFKMTIAKQKGGFEIFENPSNNLFTVQMKNAIEQSLSGDKILFEKIVAIGPDNAMRNLDDVIVTIK